MARGVTYEQDARIRRADGEYRWLIRRLAPVHDQHGHIVRWYGIGTDIEDLKRAQVALREQAGLEELARLAPDTLRRQALHPTELRTRGPEASTRPPAQQDEPRSLPQPK